MAKQNDINQFTFEHGELKRVIDSLTWRQKVGDYIFDNWTVKDILVHISAWHRKAMEEIDDLLKGKEPWIVGANIDTFNDGAVQEKKNWEFYRVFYCWNCSWVDLFHKMEQVPDEKWDETSGFVWSDGSPLTIASLFAYKYEGSNHEGGHAREIREYFEKV